ncbi:MAG: hypothetical protein R3A13_06395 [Bdellovibrionota bacterium]
MSALAQPKRNTNVGLGTELLGGKLLRGDFGRKKDGFESELNATDTKNYLRDLKRYLADKGSQAKERAVETLSALTVADHGNRTLRLLLDRGNPQAQEVALASIADLCSAKDYEGDLKKNLTDILVRFIQEKYLKNVKGFRRQKVSALIALGNVLEADPKLATKEIRDFLIDQVNGCKDIKYLNRRVAALRALRTYQNVSGDEDAKLEASLAKVSIQTLAQANRVRHETKHNPDANELRQNLNMRSALAAYNDALALVLNGSPKQMLSALYSKKGFSGLSEQLYATVLTHFNWRAKQADAGASAVEVEVQGTAADPKVLEKVSQEFRSATGPKRKIKNEGKEVRKSNYEILKDKDVDQHSLQAALMGIYETGNFDDKTDSLIAKLIEDRKKRDLAPGVVHWAARCLSLSSKVPLFYNTSIHIHLIRDLIREGGAAAGGALYTILEIGKKAELAVTIWPNKSTFKMVEELFRTQRMGPEDRILCKKALERLNPKKAEKLLRKKSFLSIGLTQENSFYGAAKLLTGQLKPPVREYYAENLGRVHPEQAAEFFQRAEIHPLGADLKKNNPPTIEDLLQDPATNPGLLKNTVKAIVATGELSLEHRKMIADILDRDSLDGGLVHFAAQALTQKAGLDFQRNQAYFIQVLSKQLSRKDKGVLEVVKALESYGQDAMAAAPAIAKLLNKKIDLADRKTIIRTLQTINPTFAENFLDKNIHLRFTNSADKPEEVVFDSDVSEDVVHKALPWMASFSSYKTALADKTQERIEQVVRSSFASDDTVLNNALKCVMITGKVEAETLTELAKRLEKRTMLPENTAYQALDLYYRLGSDAKWSQQTALVENIWEREAIRTLSLNGLSTGDTDRILRRVRDSKIEMSPEMYRAVKNILLYAELNGKNLNQSTFSLANECIKEYEEKLLAEKEAAEKAAREAEAAEQAIIRRNERIEDAELTKEAIKEGTIEAHEEIHQNRPLRWRDRAKYWYNRVNQSMNRIAAFLQGIGV